MSFGFHEQHDSIQQAIDEISSSDCERKILMFAAASNRGIGFKPTFPSNHPSVTCVYATDGDGNKYRRNPQPISRRSPRFATLGVAVRSACIKGGEVRKSGTSFATPVAAAIAALVLEFAIKNDMESKVYHKKLKTKEGMEKIFATMVTENDNVDFIYPWKLWHVKRRDTSVLDEMYQALAPWWIIKSSTDALQSPIHSPALAPSPNDPPCFSSKSTSSSGSGFSMASLFLRRQLQRLSYEPLFARDWSFGVCTALLNGRSRSLQENIGYHFDFCSNIWRLTTSWFAIYGLYRFRAESLSLYIFPSRIRKILNDRQVLVS